MDVAEMRVPSNDLVLDPFAYVPDMASKISGLGGDARGPDGDYAFHTPYVEVVEGIAHFSVNFEGLTATQGTLNLRVHMLSADSPHARLATAERVALNRLVSIGGHFALRFEAFHGVTYALYGGIIGDTDAVAQSVRVVLDRPADPNERREVAAEARNTVFGTQAVPGRHLISLDMPSLAAPVTQIATAGQLSENIARSRRDLAARGQATDLDLWRATYILEALTAYGMMQSGARGVGLGYLAGPVAAVLADKNIQTDIIAPPDTDLADVRAALMDHRVCDDATFDANVTVRLASLVPPASDLVNYDFLWTDGDIAPGVSIRDHARFIEDAMACLRPGGLAVQVVDYDPFEEGAGRAFERQDVERASLLLISRGHDLGEFRIEAGGALTDERGLSACGIICRKAPLDS